MALTGDEDTGYVTEFSDRAAPSNSHIEYEDGTIPMVKKNGGSGRMSPVRARTMKEYEQQIAELQKENFSLKLRIYFLEERMKKDWDGSGDDISKINIELRVQVESLKHDLVEKQELLKKASNALDSITTQHQVELQQACQHTAENVSAQLGAELMLTQHSVEELRARIQDSDLEIEKLTKQLSESNEKLQELVAINQALNSQCHELESVRHDLETRLDRADGSSDGDVSSLKDEVCSTEGVLFEKDRLIDQLRCALKAKDVIIEQLEEEKNEAIHDVKQQLERKVSKLDEKLKLYELRSQESDVYPTQLIVETEHQLTHRDELWALKSTEKEIDSLNEKLRLAENVILKKTEAIKNLQESLDQEKQENIDRMIASNAESLQVLPDPHELSGLKEQLEDQELLLKARDDEIVELKQALERVIAQRQTETLCDGARENSTTDRGTEIEGLFWTDEQFDELEKLRAEVRKLRRCDKDVSDLINLDLSSSVVNDNQLININESGDVEQVVDVTSVNSVNVIDEDAAMQHICGNGDFEPLQHLIPMASDDDGVKCSVNSLPFVDGNPDVVPCDDGIEQLTSNGSDNFNNMHAVHNEIHHAENDLTLQSVATNLQSILGLLSDVATFERPDSSNIIRQHMTHLLMCLKELGYNQNISTRGENIVCDSTVPDEGSVGSPTDSEMLKVRDYPEHTNADGEVSLEAERKFDNIRRKTDSGETSVRQTQEMQRLEAEVSKLNSDISALNTRLQEADGTISLLKKQIELSAGPDGSSSPGFNPDLIIMLANEVERLNAELDEYKTSNAGGDGKRHSMQSRVRGQSPGSRKRSHIPVRAATPVSTESFSMKCDGVADNGHQGSDAVSSSECSHTGFGDEVQVSSTDHVHQMDMVASVQGHGDQDSSFLKTPSFNRRILDLIGRTPIDVTSASNRRAFAELQAEVERLRRRLELTELENSRLLEQSARDSIGLMNTATSDRHQGALSTCLDGSLLKSSSGEVTLAAGFLKKLVDAHKHDRGCLQRHLAKSHETCNLMRQRMEELVGFLQELLIVTPPQKGATERRAKLTTCLNETRSMLADLMCNLSLTGDVSLEVSQLELELSSFADADITASFPDAGSDISALLSVPENDKLKEQELKLNHLQSNIDELVRHRDGLQTLVNELAQKLATAEHDAFIEKCRNSDQSRDYESCKKLLGDVTKKLESSEQQNMETSTLLHESRTQLDELTETLRKTLAKNEELTHVKREMETVLVEQERQLMECEDRIKQMAGQHDAEMETLRVTVLERTRTLNVLGDERKNMLEKISALEETIQRLKDDLEHERSAAVTKDDHSKSGLQDRDGVIAKLKALVRENQSTAERLREELNRMNEEAKDKNRTIVQLRQTCKQLSIRCGELEVALCQSSADLESSLSQYAGNSSRASGMPDRLSGVGKCPESDNSIEMLRHSLDFDEPAAEIDVSSWRERHGSTQMSLASLPASLSTSDTQRQHLERVSVMSLPSLSEGQQCDSAHVSAMSLPINQRSSTNTAADGRSKSLSDVNNIGDADRRFQCQQAYAENDVDLQSENAILYQVLCTARQQLVAVELELNSLRQRLEESTAVNHALRLELELTAHEQNKENVNGAVDVKESVSNCELTGVLAEIHNLRVQLDRCITSNDSLRRTINKSGLVSHGELPTGINAHTENAPCASNPQKAAADVPTKSTNDISSPVTADERKPEAVTIHMVCTRDVFEQLKSAVEHSYSLIHELESVVERLLSDSGNEVSDNVKQTFVDVWRSLQEQRQLFGAFWLSPVLSSAVNEDKLCRENESLRNELAELRQRYLRAKLTIKTARERVDSNNKKKEEYLRRHSKNNDEAIIEQINKTRQVLAQTSRNLESVHRTSANSANKTS